MNWQNEILYTVLRCKVKVKIKKEVKKCEKKGENSAQFLAQPRPYENNARRSWLKTQTDVTKTTDHGRTLKMNFVFYKPQRQIMTLKCFKQIDDKNTRTFCKR